MPLTPGDPAPWFTAPTPSNPEFMFDTAAGRYVLMVFLPSDPEMRGQVLIALGRHRARFDDAQLACFVVVRDETTAAQAKDLKGLRWFLDRDERVSRLFGAVSDGGPERPHWLLLDPNLRTLAYAPIDQAKGMFGIIARLPPVADHAGTALHAPVLVAPRIFEPELCQALIGLHEDGGGTFSGVMRDEGQRTVAVMDKLKKRRDVTVQDEAMKAALRERMERRLFPLVERALGFSATRIERYLVAAYDVQDGGVFHAHRDNTTLGTAHRKFAVSINLNGDFEGGDVRFPEFGPTTYRAPAGGAVVFSSALLHEATRVTAGRRYAFLSFLFDEAGAETRAAYEARAKEPA
jgi:hypothetical protein